MKRTNVQIHAVIYARVSSTEQKRSGYSLDAQVKLLRRYAREQHIKVIGEFVEAESAKKAGREKFNEMLQVLATLRQGVSESQVEYAILCEKTDRAYRNFRDYVLIDELDVAVHLVTENVVLSKNSQSSVKFLHSMKVVLAKNFIDNLQEEIKKGMTEKAEQGQYPSRAPIGYRNVRHSGKSLMEIDPDAAPIVRLIFELYTNGCPSLQQVQSVIESKVRTGDIDVDYRFSTSNIHRILSNPIYYGDYYWRGVRYHGVHEPLISKSLFLRAQQISEANRRKTKKRHTARWAYQGLLRCGDCGGIMSADRKKKQYTYYHCSGRIKPCKSRAYVRTELLDSEFEEVLSALCLPVELEHSFRESLETTSTERDELKAQRLNELRTQLTLLTRRLDLLYKDRLDHVISAEAYKAYKAEIEKESDSVEGEILLATEMNGTALRGGIEILELLKTLQTRFKEANPAERQLCLVATLSNSCWKDGGLVVEYRQPLDSIASAVLLHKKKNGISLSKNAVHPFEYTEKIDSPTSLEEAKEKFRSFFLAPTKETRAFIDLFQPLLHS